jgi:ubiquitin carboxyl-terminal hydrolase 36/42
LCLYTLGNTCFLNSVMQCLTYTPPLAAFFLAGEHKQYKATAGFSAIYEMGEHVNRALASPGRHIAPVNFVRNLRVLSKTFRKVGLTR